MPWVSKERGGLDDTLLAECEGEEMSPWKVRRQLAEEPGALCGEPGRGRAGKGEPRRPGGSADNARKEQHDSVLFEEKKKRAGFIILCPPKMNINEAISSVTSGTNECCFPRGAWHVV